MKLKKDKNLFLLVMEKGETFKQDIQEILSLKEIDGIAIVLNALGMVRKVEVGYGTYLDGKVEYQKTLLEEPLELLGLSGFVMRDENLPVHFHIYLANSKKQVLGGHLFDFEVFTFVEMALLLSDIHPRRVIKDGLFLMDF